MANTMRTPRSPGSAAAPGAQMQAGTGLAGLQAYNAPPQSGLRAYGAAYSPDEGGGGGLLMPYHAQQQQGFGPHTAPPQGGGMSGGGGNGGGGMAPSYDQTPDNSGVLAQLQQMQHIQQTQQDMQLQLQQAGPSNGYAPGQEEYLHRQQSAMDALRALARSKNG